MFFLKAPPDNGGRGLQIRTSALLGAKNSEFFEIYGVSATIREEESIFRDLVRTSFI